MIKALLNLLSKIFFFTGRLEINNVFDKPLSQEEESECFKKMKQGDKQAEEKLIKHNLRLVAHIVKNITLQKLSKTNLFLLARLVL